MKMEFDPAVLRQLNDRQLADLVEQIASAAGADCQKTAELLGNIDSLRGSLSQLTPEQAEMFLNQAGEDKSRAIYEILRKQKP